MSFTSCFPCYWGPGKVSNLEKQSLLRNVSSLSYKKTFHILPFYGGRRKYIPFSEVG